MLTLKPITDLVFQLSGRDLSIYERSFLQRTIGKQMEANDLPDLNAYCEFIKNSPGRMQELADSLNVDYSEFFRNPVTFALLEQVILPDFLNRKLSAKNKNIRIWSAGCAGGQEPYSIAMILDELITKSKTPVTFQIFATDTVEKSLKTAKRGSFSPHSLKNVPLHFLDRYVTLSGGFYSVVPDLKKHIEFSQYDLLDPERKSPPSGIYGDFDMVFCCNVLFYYAPEARKVILEKLVGSLSRRGLLVTGEVEREIIQKTELTLMEYPSSVFRRG